MSPATLEKLQTLADIVSNDSRKVTPMQLAAYLLEQAVQESTTAIPSSKQGAGDAVPSPSYIKSVMDNETDFLSQQQTFIGAAGGRYVLWMLNPARLPIMTSDEFVQNWSLNLTLGVVYNTIWLIDNTTVDHFQTFLSQAGRASAAAYDRPQRADAPGGISIIPLLADNADNSVRKPTRETWDLFASFYCRQQKCRREEETPAFRYLYFKPPLSNGNKHNGPSWSLEPDYSSQPEDMRHIRTRIFDSLSTIRQSFSPHESLVVYVPQQEKLGSIPTIAVAEKEVLCGNRNRRQYSFTVERPEHAQELRLLLATFEDSYKSYWSKTGLPSCDTDDCPCNGSSSLTMPQSLASS